MSGLDGQRHRRARGRRCGTPGTHPRRVCRRQAKRRRGSPPIYRQDQRRVGPRCTPHESPAADLVPAVDRPAGCQHVAPARVRRLRRACVVGKPRACARVVGRCPRLRAQERPIGTRLTFAVDGPARATGTSNGTLKVGGSCCPIGAPIVSSASTWTPHGGCAPARSIPTRPGTGPSPRETKPSATPPSRSSRSSGPSDGGRRAARRRHRPPTPVLRDAALWVGDGSWRLAANRRGADPQRVRIRPHTVRPEYRLYPTTTS